MSERYDPVGDSVFDHGRPELTRPLPGPLSQAPMHCYEEYIDIPIAPIIDWSARAWGIYRTLGSSDREPTNADRVLNAVLLAGPATLVGVVVNMPQSIRSIRDSFDKFINGSLNRCDL